MKKSGTRGDASFEDPEESGSQVFQKRERGEGGACRWFVQLFVAIWRFVFHVVGSPSHSCQAPVRVQVFSITRANFELGMQVSGETKLTVNSFGPLVKEDMH